MPIVEQTIKAQISQLLQATEGGDVDQAKEQFATQLASIIATAIRSATVTVQPGIAVATTGGAGSTVAPGTGTLS